MYTVPPQDGKYSFYPQKIPDFTVVKDKKQQNIENDTIIAQINDKPRKINFFNALRNFGTSQIQAQQIFTYEIFKVFSLVDFVYKILFLSPLILYLFSNIICLWIFIVVYTFLASIDWLQSMMLLGVQLYVDKIKRFSTVKSQILLFVRIVISFINIVLGLTSIYLLKQNLFVFTVIPLYVIIAQGCLADILVLTLQPFSTSDVDNLSHNFVQVSYYSIKNNDMHMLTSDYYLSLDYQPDEFDNMTETTAGNIQVQINENMLLGD